MTPAEREALILRARPPVLRYLIRLARRFPDYCHDDVIADGMTGLVRAADTYHPDRGGVWISYAITRAHGAVIDGLRTRDHLPRSLRQAWTRQAAAADEAGTARPGDGQPVSLDDTILADGEILLGSALATPGPTPDQAYETSETATELRHAVTRLPERERHIITQMYWCHRTGASIAQDLGVTESRVSQLHTKALNRLRPKVRGLAA